MIAREIEKRLHLTIIIEFGMTRRRAKFKDFPNVRQRIPSMKLLDNVQSSRDSPTVRSSDPSDVGECRGRANRARTNLRRQRSYSQHYCSYVQKIHRTKPLQLFQSRRYGMARSLCRNSFDA